jgi:hypothetical protein
LGALEKGRGGEFTGGGAGGAVGGSVSAKRGRVLGFIGDTSPVTLR